MTGSYANYSMNTNLSGADQVDVVFTNDGSGAQATMGGVATIFVGSH